MNIDPAVLLEDARAKHRRAEQIGRRARAKLGVKTTTRRSGELYYSDGKGPLGWLYEDGEDPELVRKDSQSLKKFMHLFKTMPRLRNGWTSITLPSRRTIRFNTQTGEVKKPTETELEEVAEIRRVEYAVRKPRRRGAQR